MNALSTMIFFYKYLKTVMKTANRSLKKQLSKFKDNADVEKIESRARKYGDLEEIVSIISEEQKIISNQCELIKTHIKDTEKQVSNEQIANFRKFVKTFSKLAIGMTANCEDILKMITIYKNLNELPYASWDENKINEHNEMWTNMTTTNKLVFSPKTMILYEEIVDFLEEEEIAHPI